MQAHIVNKVYQEEAKKADRYNYFPFISGDLIEKHRAQLGAQLKNDLQSYLDYKSPISPKSQSGHHLAQSYDARSLNALSQVGVGPTGSTIGKKRAVKHLFDSDYVRPEDNFRVLQDDNPLKAAAFKDALSRYENDLKRKNDGYDKYMQ